MKASQRNIFGINSYQSGSVIDFEKGVYVDSRAMNQQQYRRYYRTQTNFKRPDLNERQAGQFRLYYQLGQRLLYAKKRQNIFQITRLVRLASPTYAHEHFAEIFGVSLAISNLAQLRSLGNYLRSDIDRQKIAKWGKSRAQNALNLGLLPGISQKIPQQQRVNKIASILRDRYSSENKNSKNTKEE